MPKTITDVICPFCGTLCDDIEVVVSDDGKKLTEVYNACVIGTEKFLHSQSSDRVTRPRLHQEDGSWKEISYDEAVEYTAQMLAKAKKPLMFACATVQSIAGVVSRRASRVGHESGFSEERPKQIVRYRTELKSIRSSLAGSRYAFCQRTAQ